MGKVQWLLLAAVTGLALQSVALADPAIHWETNIDTAKRAAAQSNRLVMVIFSSPSWCPACRALDNDLASNPGVGPAIEVNYVPVRLNADLYKSTAAQYGVSALPTTLILAPTPQGEVLDSIRGRLPLDQYIGKLNQVAMDARRRNSAVTAAIPGGLGPVAAQRTTVPAADSTVAPPARVAPVADRYAAANPAMNAPNPGASPSGVAPAQQSSVPVASASQAAPPGAIQPDAGRVMAAVTPNPAVARPAVAPAMTSSDQKSPSAPQSASPAGCPPFGLDGFCPVQLTEKAVWSPGSRRWGAVHRGRTYLFIGPEEQRRFLADPDRYAPINSGDDVVLALEEGRSVSGNRAHGVFFSGRVYLFAEERTLAKFSQNPKYYAERAMVAVRSATQPTAR